MPGARLGRGSGCVEPESGCHGNKAGIAADGLEGRVDEDAGHAQVALISQGLQIAQGVVRFAKLSFSLSHRVAWPSGGSLPALFVGEHRPPQRWLSASASL